LGGVGIKRGAASAWRTISAKRAVQPSSVDNNILLPDIFFAAFSILSYRIATIFSSPEHHHHRLAVCWHEPKVLTLMDIAPPNSINNNHISSNAILTLATA